VLILILLYCFPQGVVDKGLEPTEEANETNLDLNLSWEAHNVDWVEVVYSYGQLEDVQHSSWKGYNKWWTINISSFFLYYYLYMLLQKEEVNVRELSSLIGQAGYRIFEWNFLHLRKQHLSLVDFQNLFGVSFAPDCLPFGILYKLSSPWQFWTSLLISSSLNEPRTTNAFEEPFMLWTLNHKSSCCFWTCITV